MTNELKRILIIDDHAVVRRGISATIQHELTGFSVSCDEAGSGVEALEKGAVGQYHLVILDISMPGMNGLELIPRLKAYLPHAAFLVISMYGEEQYGLKALQAGADGYINKAQVADDLLAAIELVLRGERYLSRTLADLIISGCGTDAPLQLPPPKSPLSAREAQVMELLASGLSHKEIGSHLGINSKTISSYRNRIFTKMAFTNNVEMVLYVSEHGLLRN